MGTYTLTISGMTCDHCTRMAEKAFAAAPGVVAARVSYPDKIANVETRDGVTASMLIAAVKGKGYDAELLEANAGKNPRRILL